MPWRSGFYATIAKGLAAKLQAKNNRAAGQDARRHWRVHRKAMLGVNVVEFGGLDELVKDGGSLSAAIRVTEGANFCDGAGCSAALGGIVGQADTPIIEEPGERVPAPQHVGTRLGEIVFASQLADLVGGSRRGARSSVER